MDSKVVATIITSSALSLAAIVVSLVTFFKARRVTLYQDLDRLYLEVLRMRMDRPELGDPDKTKDYTNSFKGDDRIKYDAYAFIVWNICETIADRKKEGTLFSTTWEPVLKFEANLHRAWFDNAENHGKFKCTFRKLINEDYPSPSASPGS